MQKVVLLIFLIIFVAQIALADVAPYYINSLRRYGIGYTQIVSPLIMRQTPAKDGKVLETLKFDFKGEATCEINKDRCNIDEIFATYSQSKKIALLTTLDETQDWSLVCFNQSQMPVCGWVEEDKNKFYNWSDFFNYFGKKYGLYLFKDLKKADKIIYSAPLRESNSVGSIEMPRIINPWLIRGNWILVKVFDFNNQTKTGWVNFRGDDGKLKLFVKF